MILDENAMYDEISTNRHRLTLVGIYPYVHSDGKELDDYLLPYMGVSMSFLRKGH